MKYLSSLFYPVLLVLLGFSSGLSAQTPTVIAVDDTVNLVPGVPVTFNLMANDIYPAGDSMKIISGMGLPGYVKVLSHTGGTFTYLAPYSGFNGTVTGFYLLRNASSSFVDTSMATIYYVIHDQSFDSLTINNVNARFNSWGNNFFGWQGYSAFEVPKYSGKKSVYNSTLWIGGFSPDDSLHLAAERYRQGPNIGYVGDYYDYFVGPVMNAGAYSLTQDTLWNYTWNLKKTEIDYHRAHFSEQGYVPIHDILTWPGNGNTSLGQAAMLAPFHDLNANGLYEPLLGDYPVIRGDQATYCIFNDDRGNHTETLGKKMKAEIHCMGYAFDMPGDTAFKNTIFVNYKIYNRSASTYHDTYLGVFTDIDLGYAQDDYTGCDVEGGFFYNYNGTPTDGSGQPEAYGANPPAQAVVILAGPLLDPDGIDNPKTDISGHPLCNESINGAGFGDSIIDNERYGMSRSVYFNNEPGVPNYMLDPRLAQDYYNYMLGIWMDGTNMVYGGNGHPSAGGYGPEARFMFPGLTDSLNWGTGCMPPNGPKDWTDYAAGNNPGDRRGMASMGPFTFLPGDMQEIDIAYTFARNYEGNEQKPSVAKLGEVVKTIRNAFLTNSLPNGNSFFGINDKIKHGNATLKLFPNPATSMVNVKFSYEDHGVAIVSLSNAQGTVINRLEVNRNNPLVQLDLSGIPCGLYLVTIQSESAIASQKLLIIR
jgi:hypothetical protein